MSWCGGNLRIYRRCDADGDMGMGDVMEDGDGDVKI